MIDLDEAYHGEIGREATARGLSLPITCRAYHGEIGREATAGTAGLMLET